MQYYVEEKGKALREAFEAKVLHWPMVSSRLMFGCPAYLADGKLFAFLVTDGVVITQVRKRDREALSERFTTEAFKAGEREIVRWVQVTLEEVSHLDHVMRMVKKSYDTVLEN
jgi:hypothetical protein